MHDVENLQEERVMTKLVLGDDLPLRSEPTETNKDGEGRLLMRHRGSGLTNPSPCAGGDSLSSEANPLTVPSCLSLLSQNVAPGPSTRIPRKDLEKAKPTLKYAGLTIEDIEGVSSLSQREAGLRLGVSGSTIARARKKFDMEKVRSLSANDHLGADPVP